MLITRIATRGYGTTTTVLASSSEADTVKSKAAAAARPGCVPHAQRETVGRSTLLWLDNVYCPLLELGRELPPSDEFRIGGFHPTRINQVGPPATLKPCPFAALKPAVV